MALIFCPKCGGKVSDKAYACVHCGYSAKKEEKEKRYKQKKEEEQEKLRIIKEQKEIEKRVRIKKAKKIIRWLCIGIGVLTLSFAIGNLIYSKVCFDKAIDCFTKTELENGIKYLDKSKNTWLNLNEYDQLDRLYLDGAKKCIRSNYKKAFDFFNMIEDNTIYISEIKDLYINEIDNSKDWNNNTIELFKDMERILNKNDSSVVKLNEKKEIICFFRNSALAEGNLKKAEKILTYELDKNYVWYGSPELNPVIYQLAVADYESGNYSEALEHFNHIELYENSSEYIDNILMYEELCNGEISIKRIEKANSTKEFTWNENQRQVIGEAIDFMKRLQGCYEGGRPYYFFIIGYNIYWGDETGVSNFDDAESCKFVLRNHQIEIEGGWGEKRITIKSENEIDTNIRTYQRVVIEKLPPTFDVYVKK